MFDPYSQNTGPKRIEIVPAVLPTSFNDLEAHVAQVAGKVKRVQVDIVDGIYAQGSFMHGSTWPYHDGKSFAHIVSEEKGLPHWEEVNYEFDLMIENPAERVMDYVRAGASHIVVHAKSPGAPDAVRQLVELREDGGAFSVRAGVALMSDAQPDMLEQFEAFDYVQVMGIARIGKQGEPFDVRALHLLERLHTRYPELVLQVDGSVNADTIPGLVKAGAQYLVAGSAVFGADDPGRAVKDLEALANQI